MGHGHHRSDRLPYPQMRKNDTLSPVSWDEALDDLAARLRAIIDESGPDAVGIFLGGGGYLDSAAFATAQMMRKALRTRSYYSDMTIDTVSKLLVAEMIGGFASLPRPDFGRCRMTIYVGTNPLVSHGHTAMLNSPTTRMREFTTNGEVWVLDPRRSETAAKATRHLPTKPGTDYAVLAYLVRELLRDGADRDYLDAHAQDVDALTAVVEPFTSVHAAAISGIAVEVLEDFLGAVRRAGRVCVESGTGVSMSPAGNVTAWMTWALMIVTGSLDREGGAWSNPGFLSQMDQRRIPSAPEEGWRGPGPASRPDLRTFAGEYVCAAMPDEIESGNLRALINLSGNLITCMPGTERMTSALKRLDVLLTVDIVTSSMTAASTHALPTKDQLERSDLSLGTDLSFPEVGAQFTPALVPPRGDVRSYWWILTQIGKRMGLDFFPGVDPDVTTDEEVMALLALSGRTPIDTRGSATYTVASQREFGWLQSRADAIGGWRLAPAPLVKQLSQLAPTSDLVLISRRQKHHLNSRKSEAPGSDTPAIYVSPDDAASRGLAAGDVAIVRSRHGRLKGHIKIDTTLSSGAISVPHGWDGSYNVNQLTDARDSDRSPACPFSPTFPWSSSAVLTDLDHLETSRWGPSDTTRTTTVRVNHVEHELISAPRT
nr:molybdopterin-dependent oxidoreductase [Mycobacterium sp. GA-1841]